MSVGEQLREAGGSRLAFYVATLEWMELPSTSQVNQSIFCDFQNAGDIRPWDDIMMGLMGLFQA